MKIENKEVNTEWEKPENINFENMSNEEIKALLQFRSELFNKVADAYQNYANIVYSLPIHVVYRQHSFLNLDQSFHWVKTAIDNVWKVPTQQQPNTVSESVDDKPSDIEN